MARRVFFSFHYQRDCWRVSQVRNSRVVRNRYETTPFLDGAQWEKIKRRGNAAIKHWIESQLRGTSVTVVLIGQETYKRKWVNYELRRSAELGKGLLGVRIHDLKNQRGYTDYEGDNPLDEVNVLTTNWWGSRVWRPASKVYHTYDYSWDDGYYNLGEWIEEAAIIAGR